MSRYAPGTMGFDLANNAGGNRRQRREDLASGLVGMGGLFSTLGNINQRNQAYADQQAALPLMARAYEHPNGEIPLPTGEQGPLQQGPTPMQDAFQQASSPHVNTFLENVGSAFGFGGRQGRITPQALSQIGAIQHGQVQQGMALRRDARQDAMDAMAMKLDASRINLNNAEAEKAGRVTDPNAPKARRPADISKDFTTEFQRSRMLKYIGTMRAKYDQGDTKDQNDTTFLSLQALSRDYPEGLVGPDAIREAQAASEAKVGRLAQEAREQGFDLRPDEATWRGGQDAPAPAGAPQQAPQSMAPQAQSGDPAEAKITDNGRDAEVMQLVQQFKAAHGIGPQEPLDVAAFTGWLQKQ